VEPLTVSSSQLDTFHDCRRKWWLERSRACRAWVTVSCVTDYMELQSLGRNVTMPQVGQVLRRFSSDSLNPEEYVPVKQPPGAPKKGRWIELDLAMLLEECFRYGMECGRIEGLLRIRDDGSGLIAEARVHGGGRIAA